MSRPRSIWLASCSCALLLLAVVAPARARGPSREAARRLAEDVLSNEAYQQELVEPLRLPDWWPEGCGVRRLPSAPEGVALTVVLVVLLGVLAGLLVRSLRRLQPGSSHEAASAASAGGRVPRALEDAQRLAEAGDFDGAVHLLLLLLVEHLARRRGAALSEAATARELLRTLPGTEGERRVLARLVDAVERSLFGGRPLVADDYAAALDAYRSLAP